METIKCDSEACKTHTHTKLLGTRLHLSHEYSYVHKIMLISKYFCKNEYINIDIVCIKRNFLTQIEKKGIVFTYISSKTKSVLKKISLNSCSSGSISKLHSFYTPVACQPDCVPGLFICVSANAQKNLTSSFKPLVLSGRNV